jgi:histone chaperone ASF1
VLLPTLTFTHPVEPDTLLLFLFIFVLVKFLLIATRTACSCLQSIPSTPPSSAKMSVVSLLGVNVLNNPAKFTDKYDFEITFECLEPLEKGSYHFALMQNHNANVEQILSGSSPTLDPLLGMQQFDRSLLTPLLLTLLSDQYDQELDSLLVGPIPVGVNKFVFSADAPNISRIPDAEIIGVTVILLTCAYDGREFIRVGYYVNNEYDSEELAAEPPAKPIIERVKRNVLAEKPRVTRFAIKW